MCNDSPATPRFRHLHTLKHVSLAAAGLLAYAAPTYAQTSAAGGWQFELTPYIWAAGMKGDIQTGELPKTTVDMDFSDVLDVLDFAAMGTLEARKGKLGLLLDAIYLKVSDAGTASRTGPLGNTLTVTADAELKMTILSAAIAYRAVDGRTPIDLVGGLRYMRNEVDARIDASLFGQTGSRKRSGDKEWVDPFVGVRIQHPLSQRWMLGAYADYGGFGAGSDSTWQAMAGVDYKFSDTVSAKFGYRVLSVDYDKGGFETDMKTRGLFLGVGLRF